MFKNTFRLVKSISTHLPGPNQTQFQIYVYHVHVIIIIMNYIPQKGKMLKRGGGHALCFYTDTFISLILLVRQFCD